MKLLAVLATLKAARINRSGALCAAGLALLGVVVVTAFKQESATAMCEWGWRQCDTAPDVGPSPGGPLPGVPQPSGSPTGMPSVPATSSADAPTPGEPPPDRPPVPTTSPAVTPTVGSTTTKPADPRPAPTRDPVTAAPGGYVPSVHDGPHTGRIGWQPEISTDIDDIGFRHGGEGDLFASPEGIRSVHGVLIVRVRESDVGYTRCRAMQYTAADTVIPAADLQVDDYVCAYDTVQYTAAYRIVGLPGPQEPYYRVRGTSWSD